nr:WAP four-disulfide core domain protein 2-like [Procambarus clarkii]
MKLLQLTVVLFGVVVITGADPSPDKPLPEFILTASWFKHTFTQAPPTSVCPPRNSLGYDCSDKCVGNADCGPNEFCCEMDCGKICMTRYQQTQSPSCPLSNPLLRCIHFMHNCNNDQDCKKFGPHFLCCLEPMCGRKCDPTTTQH